MLTVPEVREIVNRVTYKPGTRIDIQCEFEQNTPTLFVDLPVQDVDTLRPSKVGTRRVIPPKYLKSREALLAFIFMTVEGIEKHEVREWLRYDHQTVVDPHPGTATLSWFDELLKKIFIT